MSFPHRLFLRWSFLLCCFGKKLVFGGRGGSLATTKPNEGQNKINLLLEITADSDATDSCDNNNDGDDNDDDRASYQTLCDCQIALRIRISARRNLFAASGTHLIRFIGNYERCGQSYRRSRERSNGFLRPLFLCLFLLTLRSSSLIGAPEETSDSNPRPSSDVVVLSALIHLGFVPASAAATDNDRDRFLHFKK